MPIIIVSNLGNRDRFLGNNAHITLKIEKGQESGRKYSYKYSEPEFLVESSVQTITFELLDFRDLGVHNAYIAGYLCSRPTALKPIVFKFPGGTENRLGPVVNDDIFENQKPPCVVFEPAFSDKELISIGLIIAIRETPFSDPRYILCDPQVGNGPPAPGSLHGKHTPDADSLASDWNGYLPSLIL